MTRPAVLCVSLVLASVSPLACDDSSEEGEKNAEEERVVGMKPDEPKPAGVLTLGDAKLFEKDEPGNPLTIAADGTVTLEGKTVGTFTADGKLTMPDGKIALQAQKNGSVLVADKESPLRLTDTGGTVSMAGKTTTLTFRSGGVLDINPPPANAGLMMGHEGCDGAMARTCTMAMFAMLSGGSSSGAPKAEPAAPPTEPEPAKAE